MEHKEWLKTATRLNFNLGIYEEYARRIADLIYTKVRRDKWRKDPKPVFTRIIANLRMSYELGRPIYYSRDTNRKYRGVGGRSFLNLVEAMTEEELIDCHNGYYDVEFGGKSSRMWASKQLISLFVAIQPEDVVLDPPERLVELKERPIRTKKGKKRKAKRIDYEMTVEIGSMVEQLRDYGNMMLNHNAEIHIGKDIELSKKGKEQLEELINKYRYTRITLLYNTVIPNSTITVLPSKTIIQDNNTTITYDLGNEIGIRFRYCWLHRSFSEIFQLGGRYYGGPWQFIGSELRKYIFIDGEPTVELDFSGLHLRMLYHLEGIDYTGDPYAFGKPEWRPLYKLVALIMINCKNRRYSTKSIKKEFGENGYTDTFGDEIMDKDIIKRMVADLDHAHGTIKDYFCSDIGIKLQYIDSEITSYVLDYFIDKDVPVLPVHDSYVVPEKYKDELYQVMMEAYEHHLGFEPVIK